MARSDRRMRRLVCAPAPAGLLCFAVERAGLVNGVLRIGPVLQLSPLHGDDLSRLSQRGGFSEVPHFYGSHHGPHCADVDSVALLVRAIPWIFTLYLVWSPWHYSGQNYGLFMMFARRGGATPSAAGRRALYSAFLISYLILLLSFLTGPSNDPLFVSPGIPERISSIAVLALGVAFVGCSAYGWSGLAEQVGWRRLLPAADPLLHAMPMVSFADRVVPRRGTARSAKPLQQRSVRGHALGPISLDHQLLRPP